ncbi:hypothetical protein ABIB54_003600 [Frigoribacterium sp. UYMn621]
MHDGLSESISVGTACASLNLEDTRQVSLNRLPNMADPTVRI